MWHFSNWPGLSLFRALLRQVSVLRLPESSDGQATAGQDTLQNLVRYRFQRDKSIRSPSQVANGLRAGYDALDLVHAHNTQTPGATSRLANLIKSAARYAERTVRHRAALAAVRSPTSPQKLPKIAAIKDGATKANHSRYEHTRPVLERPLPLSEIKSGKRRVPYLVSAQGVPFLRYSKPQPISLGRVIRQHQKWEQKKWDQKHEAEADVRIGGWEDEWDDLVEGRGHQPGVENTGGMPSLVLRGDDGNGNLNGSVEPSWSEGPLQIEHELMTQINEKDRKHTEMGRKMWDVVVKERELAQQEKEDAKIQRKAARMAVRATEESPSAQDP